MNYRILAIGGCASAITQLVYNELSITGSDHLAFMYSDVDMDDLADLDVDEKCKVLLDKKSVKDFPGKIFNGADKIFMVAALGGKTGTEYILPAIRAAEKAGITEVSLFVVLPFIFEGKKRTTKAFGKLEQILSHGIDHLEIFNNEEIMARLFESDKMNEILSDINELIAHKITEVISNKMRIC